MRGIVFEMRRPMRGNTRLNLPEIAGPHERRVGNANSQNSDAAAARREHPLDFGARRRGVLDVSDAERDGDPIHADRQSESAWRLLE